MDIIDHKSWCVYICLRLSPEVLTQLLSSRESVHIISCATPFSTRQVQCTEGTVKALLLSMGVLAAEQIHFAASRIKTQVELKLPLFVHVRVYMQVVLFF